MSTENIDESFEERHGDNRGYRRVRRPKIYRQWYERDPERLDRELRALCGSYDEVFLCKSEDKNLVVVVGAETGFIALEAPHNYPMSPPQAFALSYQLGVAPGEDVEIDIFQRTGFIWNPQANVRDAAVAAEKALAAAAETAEQGPNARTPNEAGGCANSASLIGPCAYPYLHPES